MLTIEFVNTSGDKVAVADYIARVLVNGVLLHEEVVTGHRRAQGWRALVRKLGTPGHWRAHLTCPGAGRPAVVGSFGIGHQCAFCGLQTIPYPNGTVRRHNPLPPPEEQP